MHNAGRVAEVEINPLICTSAGAVAADALISMDISTGNPDEDDEDSDDD
ncbi:MAG: hypothetical protein AAF737_05190 [Pseudomonadota bacterium]